MEAEAAASPEIKALLAIAGAAALWMFIAKTKSERRTARLVEWIRQNHPAIWAALPWDQRILFREKGFAEIARRGAISDAHFVEEYEIIAGYRPHILYPGVAGGIAIALILMGLRFFGWNL